MLYLTSSPYYQYFLIANKSQRMKQDKAMAAAESKNKVSGGKPVFSDWDQSTSPLQLDWFPQHLHHKLGSESQQSSEVLA